MTETQRHAPWLWEEFETGLTFPPQRMAITPRDLALWREVSGQADAVPGRALLVPLMMRACLAAIHPRLPGNVHAAQELRFFPRMPQMGEGMVFTFAIGALVERKGRGWVDILIDCRSEGGEALMTGKMVTIWAGRRATGEHHV